LVKVFSLLNNIETSRRDDLESLGYLLVYFLKGTLPWDSIEEDGISEYRELIIKEKKASISVKNLCEGLP
jgi:casein kinase I family protein HRR25